MLHRPAPPAPRQKESLIVRIHFVRECADHVFGRAATALRNEPREQPSKLHRPEKTDLKRSAEYLLANTETENLTYRKAATAPEVHSPNPPHAQRTRGYAGSPIGSAWPGR